MCRAQLQPNQCNKIILCCNSAKAKAQKSEHCTKVVAALLIIALLGTFAAYGVCEHEAISKAWNHDIQPFLLKEGVVYTSQAITLIAAVALISLGLYKLTRKSPDTTQAQPNTAPLPSALPISSENDHADADPPASAPGDSPALAGNDDNAATISFNAESSDDDVESVGNGNEVGEGDEVDGEGDGEGDVSEIEDGNAVESDTEGDVSEVEDGNEA